MSDTVAPASSAPVTLTLPPRPLWVTFLAFLAPMLVANILQLLSGTVNNVYLGQMIGVKALAAVSSFFPVVFFCVAFAIGLGTGASVLIGQAWGARQAGTTREVAGATLALGVLLGLVVAVLGGAFTEPMLRALATPPDILPDAVRVARILLISMPGLFIFILATAMLRGVGDTVSPLYTLIISTVIGLALTPALIRGWLGLPRLGVTSSSWASVAGFLVALLWLWLHLLRKNSPLKPDVEFLRHLHLNPRLLKNVLRLGVPSGLNMIVVAFAEVALLSIVNRYGSNATAAYGAVNQVVGYVQFPAVSIATTASVLGAQAIGAGRADRLSAIMRTGAGMNLLLTGALVALCYLFSRQLVGFFITSAPVVEMAQTLLHIMLWSVVVFGMASLLAGIMRASGTVWGPMAISIGCVLVAMMLLQGAYYQWVWREQAIKKII